MSQETNQFFTRESSWTLSHQHGESHLVVFSTQNGLALSVLVYIQGHLANGPKGSRTLDTKHFPATTTQQAKADAIEWAKQQIDKDLVASIAS